MACPDLDTMLNTLRPGGPSAQLSAWAILDGARNERIFPLLRDSGLDYECLYSGYLPRKLQAAAPYIVKLSQNEADTRRLINLAWGNSWGIFLGVKDSSNLRHHLKKFLRVRTESGKRLLFRYYDPRVFRTYLPTCLPKELKTVFGPIDRFLMEAEQPDTLIEFTFNGSGLGQRRVVLQRDTQ